MIRERALVRRADVVRAEPVDPGALARVAYGVVRRAMLAVRRSRSSSVRVWHETGLVSVMP